ncbi:MAG: LysR family transcriptional regulator [Planctomycetota bacterium]
MQDEKIRIFCDLVESQSFSKAADKNFISQSAVSQQLANLEKAFNCQLINRAKRPIELAPAGELFYAACKDITRRSEQFRSDLEALRKSTKTRINVAAIYSIGMHSLPPYIKRFIARYPEVNVHIEYFNSARIYELVLFGKIDIGLVAVPSKDPNIEVFHFQDEPLVLVCSPEHPFANLEVIDIHRLSLQKFIAFEKDVPTRMLIDGILRQYNVAVQPVMEFDNIETVKRAVEINSGISILPLTAVIQELNDKTIRSLRFINEKFLRPTGIIVRKGKMLSEAGRYLIELLRKPKAE